MYSEGGTSLTCGRAELPGSPLQDR
jgi:hypothetical protein